MFGKRGTVRIDSVELEKLKYAATRLEKMESTVMVVYTTEVDNPDPITAIKHTSVIMRQTFLEIFEMARFHPGVRLFSMDNDTVMFELGDGKFLDIAIMVP